MLPTVLFALFAALAPVSASAVHMRSRHLQHARHAAAHLNARAPVPVPVPAPVALDVPVRVRKRSSKKCKPRSSSSAAAAPSSSSAAPSPSQAPPVANPGGDPATQTPSPSPTPKPDPTTHKAPPPPPQTTSSQSSGGGGGNNNNNNNGGGNSGGGSDPFGSFHAGTNGGADLTFYELGLTACGISFSDSDMVCAIPESMFDSVPGSNGNPNDNPVCNKRINITYQGKTVNVAVVDRCTGCTGNSIDLSPAAFNQLADPSAGRVHGASWTWA